MRAGLWVLERLRPAALVVAAERLAGCRGVECARRGLALIAARAPDGWVKRNAEWLLARPEALAQAARQARMNGGPPESLVEEILARLGEDSEG